MRGECYIGKHIVEVFEFVIGAKDLLLVPYSIEMHLDKTLMKSTWCTLNGGWHVSRNRLCIGSMTTWSMRLK